MATPCENPRTRCNAPKLPPVNLSLPVLPRTPGRKHPLTGLQKLRWTDTFVRQERDRCSGVSVLRSCVLHKNL